MEGSKKHYVDDTARFFSAGLTIRQKEPKNLEAPFDRIDSYLTPAELFYIRSHFPTPLLDRASYQLRIDGAVRRPFSELRGVAKHATRNASRDPGVRR
jgi:DMSO/TMAO reductase YedYZ molybdopterin-dependent catalytic subunit